MDKCKKVKYATEKEALVQLEKIISRSSKAKNPSRAYSCFCGAYHLTSRLDIKDIQTENELLRSVNQKLVKQINELVSKENMEIKSKIAIDEIVINQRKQINKLQDYIRNEIVLKK